jgi:hypothetical protein
VPVSRSLGAPPRLTLAALLVDSRAPCSAPADSDSVP